MKEKKKTKLSISEIFTKFAQFIYLSVMNSGSNSLWESAASCSFSFIFSIVPVVLIIFTLLINFLKISPDLVQVVINFCEQYKDIYDIRPLITNLIEKKSLSFIDIFLGIWVIWMARKLFLSIVQALNRIFLSASKRMTVGNQIVTFVSEFVSVVILITLIIFAFAFDKLLHLPLLESVRNIFPRLFRTRSNVLISSVVYLLFFAFTLYSYRFMTGSKPKLRLSAFYAALSTGITFIISFAINKFMNFSNYNVIYGTISTLIILLFKVYLFFVVFLFCAQMLYVSQFFEVLIIAYIYTQQSNSNNSFQKFINQKLFINPSIYKLETERKSFRPGECIYTEGDKADYVYFIKEGQVSETKDALTTNFFKGDFFGEVPGFLHTARLTSAYAVNDTELMLIKTKNFKEIIQKNQPASAKVLERVNAFTRE